MTRPYEKSRVRARADVWEGAKDVKVMPEARTTPAKARASRKPGGSRPRRAAVALACVTLAACGGAGDGATRPTAALSSMLAAESQMRRLTADWARAGTTERVGMERSLEAFKKDFPNDPLARLAETLLAWIALNKGDNHVAEVRARLAEKAAGPGTVADVAHTVQGAALRRQGQPQAALALLEPLVSKLIDGWARSLFNAEIVDAAVEAGRWERALGLMSVWLRETGPEERATVRGHLERSLDRVPAAELSRWLDRARGIELGQAAEEELEIRGLVAHELAVVARANKDVELAQHLIAASGRLLGDQGDAIAALAAGASKARVEAHTVGLLISLRNDKTRRRGADVADGVAHGLGLPGGSARLVSRDDHGSPERIPEALAALSADGASIVIAGSDEAEATAAAAFAEAHQIPVLLLRAPAPGASTDGKGRFTFVIGVEPADVEGALVSALASRGGGPVAVVADEPLRPRAPRPEVAVVRGCSDAAAPWKPLNVAGVVLSAQPDCARVALAAAAPLKLRFGAGFESDPLPLPVGSLVATAGIFPIGAEASPALRTWLEHHRAPPSWWAALGHDAAVLAWAGVSALPKQGTEDPREVAVRRAWAASALAAAQAELWTTEARGFAGARALPRTIGVREAAPGKARLP